MWTRTHLGKWQNTTNTTAKRSALSQQVTTRLQGTDTTAQHTPTWSIANKNDSQKNALEWSVKILSLTKPWHTCRLKCHFFLISQPKHMLLELKIDCSFEQKLQIFKLMNKKILTLSRSKHSINPYTPSVLFCGTHTEFAYRISY